MVLTAVLEGTGLRACTPSPNQHEAKARTATARGNLSSFIIVLERKLPGQTGETDRQRQRTSGMLRTPWLCAVRRVKGVGGQVLEEEGDRNGEPPEASWRAIELRLARAACPFPPTLSNNTRSCFVNVCHQFISFFPSPNLFPWLGQKHVDPAACRSGGPRCEPPPR